MGAAKRLKNHENLRGTLTSDQGGNGPSDKKRGLRGAVAALWANSGDALNPHSRTAFTATVQTGQDNPDTGDVGVGVDAADASLVGRGSQYQATGDPKVSGIPDNRSLLDSDPAVLGADAENAVLATFTVAEGTNGAGTFEATAANTGQVYRLEVYDVGADTDTDGELLLVDYFVADGSADVVTVPTGPNFTPGDDVVVYAREGDATTEAAVRSFGPAFATRRVVTTDDA